MTRRNPPAKWVLPATVNPPTSTCIMVPVPDDPMHMAAFLGAIADLGSGYKWQDDPLHKAKDVAKVWQEIADNLSECTPMIQFRQSDDCTLQVSFDGGVIWNSIFNAYICARGAAQDQIQSDLNDGTLGGGGQQPGQGGGIPGQCYDYSITLQGNNRWLAPISLEADDTIEVTLATGAWWDGDIGQAWKCPSGVEFILGTCNDLSHNTDSGDPLPSLYHMRLIGNLPEDGTTPYFDMFNTLYTVPGGVTAGALYLQANDGALGDNEGSINCHVQICKNTTGVCFNFNFLTSDGGWHAYTNDPNYGVWTDGVGWVSGISGIYHDCTIQFTFPSNRTVTRVKVWATYSNVDSNSYCHTGYAHTDGPGPVSNGSTVFDITVTTPESTPGWGVDCLASQGGSGSVTITQVVLYCSD